MSKVPVIVSISDLRRGTAALLRKLEESNEPIVVTKRGRAVAVLLSIDEYERRERDVKLLQLLLRGEQEIAAGVGYDVDDVLAQARERVNQQGTSVQNAILKRRGESGDLRSREETAKKLVELLRNTPGRSGGRKIRREEAYEGRIRTARSPDAEGLKKRIREAEEDIAAGRVADADEVFKDE